jgi:hypothetical protein
MKYGPWFRYDFSQNSDYLIVGFGSVRMFIDREKNKGWEWDKTFNKRFTEYKFNKLFVGDINNSWWQTSYEGLSGYGPLVLRDFLLEKIKESGATKTLFLGVSMGGYGSILFGCLTKATKVMAFSPQTMLSDGRRKRKNLYEKFKPYDIDENLTDLKKVLKIYENNETIYKIWYGKFHKGDTEAAKRISEFKNVFLFPIDTNKHNPIMQVFKSGDFTREVINFFEN